jgi:endonuclease G
MKPSPCIRTAIAWIVLCLCPAGAVRGDFASLREALPAHAPGPDIVEHAGYTLRYSETHEQAAWVAYVLTAERLAGTASRSGDFRPDPAVPTGSATPADYWNSGYDRGHLAPAADMKWSARAMSESFLMSNMSPMSPEFNRGVWERLESRVREWAGENGELYIVVGPVLADVLPVIGKDRVAVPRAFFKVILDYRVPDYKGIGFLMPNEPSSRSLDAFAVPIDSVEKATGIDFFPALPDSLERAVEGSLRPAAWGLTGREIAAAPVSSAGGAGSSSATESGEKGLRISTGTAVIGLAAIITVVLVLWILVMMLARALGIFGKRRRR